MNNEHNGQPARVNPYIQLVQLLDRAFTHFNKIFAAGELKHPIITVASVGRKNALGWFRAEGWRTTDGDKEHINEINISAEDAARGWNTLCETLLHEMAHLWNHQHKIEDCNAVQYHNKHFKTAAEMFGLKVTKMKNKGFAATDLDAKAIEAIKSLDIKTEEVPQIARRVRRGPGAQNSFVLCTHDDKARLVEMARDAGMSQVEFMSELLLSYQARGIARTAQAAEVVAD